MVTPGGIATVKVLTSLVWKTSEATCVPVSGLVATE